MSARAVVLSLKTLGLARTGEAALVSDAAAKWIAAQDAFTEFAAMGASIISLQATDIQEADVAETARALAAARAACVKPASIDLPVADAVNAFAQNDNERRERDALIALTRALISQGESPRWVIPLTLERLYHLEQLFDLAIDAGAAPMLWPIDLSACSAHDLLFAADFLRYRVLGDDVGRFSAPQRAAFQTLLKDIDDGAPGRSAPLPSALFACGADDSGAPSNLSLLIQDAADVLPIGVRAHIARSFCAAKPDREGALAKALEEAVLIGAYGGEHIGDAAILGGVLLRLHRRHGLTKATLFTQRPAHTKHLIPMLDTPVTVSVEEYQLGNIDKALSSADAVAFAGGPLIDLPKQLVRHLYAASRAKSQGKPFLMEGIGPGPIPRWPSRVTAERLVSLADYISLRTQDNAKEPIVQGVPFDVGRDPAFDYLDTRQGPLTRIAPWENAQLDALLRGAENRPLIGVNIRPIHHHYTVADGVDDRAAYTKMVEDRFEQRLAEAITTFDREHARKPVFVFFPMNAIQFGLSDLKSAYRIARRLGDGVDFRVWEADASLDGVLALIRQLDVAITMRFHATIFALSQKVEAIGIDYRIGARDKVAAVLSDVGKGDQCARIDEMTPDWMLGQLRRFVR